MLRNDLFKPWFVGEKDWGFEIIDGEFKEVTVQIEKLEFPAEDSPELQLDYHVVHKPDHISDEDIKGDMFKAVMEAIINDILREAIDIHKQARDDDTKEPSTE
ncbi:MAG: hypothetical protein ACO294_10255 [Methylococcales bacterium]